ncbi:TyrR/PhhR family helix-turn-helix DNA-binding protein [Catenovulum maritimum]|uniref:Transcriptional regulatory protein TyrR n=1 Tax=Catenovulum maritimum TaxID=1513271 RepID=A0A0J8GRI4_9ALTE|nr:TyrR/PhhR family helix-turn-helix DNA-binding protein [Catenovulum maritimum]KMT63894.1 hypothetical protein XM47_17245 [Catenovulum maritimum]
MRLEIFCEHRAGITQDVLEVLVRHQIELDGVEADHDYIYLNFPKIAFAEFQHLMPEMRLIKGVKDVKTVDHMPFELQQFELNSILTNSSELIVSLDSKGHVIRFSIAAKNTLGEKVFESDSNFIHSIKGFNLHKWIEQKPTSRILQVAEINHQVVQLELTPIWLPAEGNSFCFVGVFIRLQPNRKSYPLANQQDFILNNVVQHSNPMRKFIRELKKTAREDLPLVIYGEIGTGKSYFAELSHYLSANSTLKLIKLDCAELTGDEILTQCEAEIDHANLGSVILLNFDRLKPLDQEKIYPVVSQIVSDGQLNLILTSQVNLNYKVAEGQLDELLYNLVNQLEIRIPALRERQADIVELTQLISKKCTTKLERAPVEIDKETLDQFAKMEWQGNVAQLERVIKQAVIKSDENILTLEDFELTNIENEFYQVQAELVGSLDDAVKQFENAMLRRLYPHFPSTRQLAHKLGLSHTAIANKLREYGINKNTVKVIKK